jgi:hypothetical protein
MEPVVGEQGHGHAVVEACWKQVLPPSARVGEWYRESRRRHGRLKPVQPISSSSSSASGSAK